MKPPIGTLRRQAYWARGVFQGLNTDSRVASQRLRTLFNRSGRLARLGGGVGRSRQQMAQRLLRLAVAGEDADHVARPGGRRAVSRDCRAKDDDLTGGIADEFVIRWFHDLSP